MRHLSLFVVIFALSFSGLGCGSHVKTGVSPTADIRNAAGKVEETGNVILKTVVKAQQDMPDRIKRETVDQVALAINRLGHVGLDLNGAIDAYLAAKAAGKDITLSRAAVQKILTSVDDVMKEVGKALPPGTLQTVDQLVQQVLGLVIQIRTEVL